MSSPTQISTNLYLGSIHDMDANYPKRINADLIINVAYDCNYTSDIPLIHLMLKDSPTENLSDHFDKIIDEIVNHNMVFIHCYAGKSRSVAFVLAYLMKVNNLTLKLAYEFVSSKRNICMNMGFIVQLMDYEKKLFNIPSSTLDYDETAIKSIVAIFHTDVKKTKEAYYENNRNYDKTIDYLLWSGKSESLIY